LPYVIGTDPIEFFETAFSSAMLPGKIVIRDRYGNIEGAGKKPVTLIVGTTQSGHTLADCDYLCDGVDDQVEINAAVLQALPAGGGKIAIREGTYNITDTIWTKANVTIEGMGASTTLKRMFDGTTYNGLLVVGGGHCKVTGLLIDGNKAAYSYADNRAVWLLSDYNTVAGIGAVNCSGVGIHAESSKNTIKENVCRNCNAGIIMLYDDNLAIGNNCRDNDCGLVIFGNRNLADGNIFMRGTGLTTDYTSTQYTINLQSGANNLITNNHILGKNYVNSGGTTNTFANNKYI
jgi:parallel beta-helix repeat protein